MPPKITFLPGTIIRSAEMNTNFKLIFNKRVDIPFRVENITPGATTYTLLPTQITSIKALLPLDETTGLQVTDITQGLIIDDIVDVLDHDSGMPLRNPFPDSPDSVSVFGKITTVTSNPDVVIISFYKNPAVPVPLSITTSIDIQIPVRSAFHALPPDFLRTEFVNTFEEHTGEDNDIDRLFENTGVSRSAVLSPNLKTYTDTHIGASTNVHGLAVGSSVVGTTDSQQLSNKSFTTVVSLGNGLTSSGTTIPLNNKRMTGAADPVDAGDLTTKSWVQGAIGTENLWDRNAEIDPTGVMPYYLNDNVVPNGLGFLGEDLNRWSGAYLSGPVYTSSDIEFDTNLVGIILKSRPSGIRYRLTVDDDGVLITEPVA